MRIATMNVQNMRLRHAGGEGRLDGARDDDIALDRLPGAPELDTVDRRLTARLIGKADADVLALQEVFDRETLDHFHDRFLLPEGIRPYPHRLCLPGNDGRGLDIALLSRLEIARAESHAAVTAANLQLGSEPLEAGQPIFRRDCLEAEVAGITFFVCHLKAPYPDPEAAWQVRRLEARAVRRLIERRFPEPERARWIVLGDLNEPADPAAPDAAVAALSGGFSHDPFARLDPCEGWSCFEPTTGRYSRPDAILLSPALAAEFPDARTSILRAGLGAEATRFTGDRLAGVGRHRPHASDHAALVVELPGPRRSVADEGTT